MSLMYGQKYNTKLTPFALESSRRYQPEQLQDRLLRLWRQNQPMFLEVEGRRISLGIDDFSLAAKVACAYHMGVNYQVTDSDDNHDSGEETLSEDESDPENSHEFLEQP